MDIRLEEQGGRVVATMAGVPGCGIGPDAQTAVQRLRELAQAQPLVSPFATVRKRLAER